MGVRNAVGSVLHASMTVGERYIAAGITSPLRRGLGGKRTSAEGVTFREANAYLFGIHQSFVDATKAGFKAFVHAAPQTDIETSVGRYAMAQPFEFNAERAAKWKKGGLMVIPDMAMTGLFGTLRTLGIRPSLGMDEFTKVMTRRMQINALAAREASYRSARLRGKEADRVYAKTLDAVTQRPTAEAFVRAKNEFEAVGAEYDPAKSYAGDTRLEEAADILASVDLHEMANDYARLMAFQKTGPAVEAFEKAMKYIPIVKALYVPFLRTPLNLVRAGMVDRNPALAWITKENRAAFKTYFAALDGQEKALSRGGAEADIVMARMVSGMALMGSAAMLFANGDLVGKRSPAEEQDGIKSYSIRLGGRWYQYSTLSPVAEMIGITADLYQTMRDRDLADDQSTALAGGVTGADETAFVVTKFLNGKVFVTKWGGVAGDGGSPETLSKLATIAAEQEVRALIVEDNFSDGMFRRLLTPVLLAKHTSKWRCGIEGVKVHGMKERRIVGALEPVMKQHRLVIDREVLKLDLAVPDRIKSGVFQMTHITAQRGALKHDDRIDVLALAVDYWKQHMAIDAAQAEADHRKKLDREFEKRFFAGTASGQLLNKTGRQRGAGRRMI